VRFLLLYSLSGIAGGLAHTFSDPDSMKPLIGASGAIAGVLGAYVLLRPRAKVVVLLAIVPVRIGAMWVIAIWLALQVLGILMPQAEGEIVSYWGTSAASSQVSWLCCSCGGRAFHCLAEHLDNLDPVRKSACSWVVWVREGLPPDSTRLSAIGT
jgi:Rhomboid family